jgi:hypothetical protein
MTLDAADIDAIAEALTDKLLSRLELDHFLDPPRRYVDASDVAREIGMSRAWVYRNKDMLGAERRGTGPKARLRFKPETTRARLATQDDPPQPSSGRRAGRPPGLRRQSYSGPLLPIKGLTGRSDQGTVASTAKRPGGAATPRAMAPRSKP